ncbi:MAG: hypothetical protein ACLFQK_10845 [Fibrobacterota bacterium]
MPGILYIYGRCGRGFVADYDKYSEAHLDRYGVAKVEAIYNFSGNFYGGAALSKER